MRRVALILAIIILVIIGAVIFFYSIEKNSLESVVSFEDCERNGYPVMESFPRQCRIPDGRNFVEEIEDEPTEHAFIRVFSPQPGSLVESPLLITGEARGNWYFEASFPVELLDTLGNRITLSPSYVMTSEDWMTNDFVPFEALLEFSAPNTDVGTLVLYKNNSSGLPEHDDQFEVQVKFKEGVVTQKVCKPTGCSEQVCSDKDVITTCEFLPEYACYPLAICQIQSSGECGWTETQEFKSCLASIPLN